jgi:two-component system nitrogen regulation sensor histidine kinase NtrY
VSRLSFRIRLFIALLVVSAIPLVVVASVRLGLLTNQPSIDRAKVIQPVVTTEKTLNQELAKTQMTPQAQAALVRHDSTVQQLSIKSLATGALANQWRGRAPAIIAAFVGVLVLLIAGVGALLSRQYAAPLNEIVDWTRRIQRREPLPPEPKAGAMPELITLQRSLYELQQGLEQARATELESERLRAFGEVARRVAHEMKNPLTPIRLAVRQLARRAPPEMQVELEVIATESARLEAMAREFAELGRLPEGVASPVDLCELLDELLKNTVPDGMEREFRANQPGVTLEGYYDPLRRVFSNLLRNAVEACKGSGKITISVDRDHDRIEVLLSDNGPGIPVDKRDMIFEPYFSGKPDGTGLGLAIVRQTIEQHHGSIAVSDTSGGGATFLIRFPA